MDSLPPLFQRMVEIPLDDSLVAFASHVAGPLHPGGLQSWDLSLHGEGFEPLTCDPFSFAGDFLVEGLDALRTNLLGPAGFTFPAFWPVNPDGSEYHCTVQWTAQP